MPEEEAKQVADMVAISALKYGDLSNQASKDYVFDIERFTSFEGDTGPYILYTIVRIKSILSRYVENSGDTKAGTILAPAGESEKDMMLALSNFNATVENAFAEKAPHKICSYIYDLANVFNHFYHETKILSEEDAQRRDRKSVV